VRRHACDSGPLTITAHLRQERAKAPAELWPAEVDLILSALDAASSRGGERRIRSRMPYRVRAELRLYSDTADADPWVLYTRDVDTRGLGFITPHRLPLGYGGVVELFTPRSTQVAVACTVLRCRVVGGGWYEGSLSFNREQWMFEVE
jgi:hypothetical protein